MDLTPYVETLRRELAVVAETAGSEARSVAARLSAALEPATRLMLLEALSAASDEISLGLAPGSVDMRLRGVTPSFVVTPPDRSSAGVAPAPSDAAFVGDDAPLPLTGPTSRINVRLPEALRPRIEVAAAQEGLSVNAWLVRAAAAALAGGHQDGRSARQGAPDRRRYVGWVG